MTDNTQPEALRLAEQYDYGDPVAHSNTWKAAVCTELRRQHARIAELKARVQELGAMARENRSRRIVELEAQLEALRAALAASPTPPAEQQAAPKAAPGKRLTRKQIREVFMANGFTVKEGQTDLKQYVYDAAHALLELVAAPQQEAQEPWGACVSGRVFVGGLPEHARKLAEAENLPIQWLYRAPQPAPAPLSDEREAFEAAWEKLHGKRPVLWDTAFKEAKMDVPSHSAGKYFYRDAQAAWEAWQARAALAAQGGKA